jgi:Terminase RNaseH-like domain
MARGTWESALVERFVQADIDELIDIGKLLDEPCGIHGTLREGLARGLLEIRTRDGGLAPFRLNEAQREYAKAGALKNIVLKARQLGITTYVASQFFLNTITRPGTLTVQVAHDQSSAESIFRIVHRFLENLPEEMREGPLITSRENARQIVFPLLDSEYRVESAMDENAGRGLTIHNLHCSEVARWPRNAAETLASLRAAVPRCGGEIVLESTPNGAAGCFYEEWQTAPEKGYTRHFFPWWKEKSYCTAAVQGELTQDEQLLMAAVDLTREQIGFRRELKWNYGKLAKQEFAESAEECFLASGECVFEVDVIEQRLPELRGPVERRENGRLEIYYPAVRGREYVIGVDPAGGGVDGDYATAEVIEKRSGLQCAELRGHYGPAELARKVEELGHEYNDAMLAVERNNHGTAVIVCLEQSGYRNLYIERGQAGWLTTSASKPRMVETFASVLRKEPFKFESQRLLQECKAFIRHEDGTCAAASGSKDDLVMAMGIAVAVNT